VEKLRRAAAKLGYQVRTEVGGHTVAGPAGIDQVEYRLGVDLREREIRDSRVQALNDHKAKQQAEREQAYRESPEGRLEALEAKLAESSPSPEPQTTERYQPVYAPDGSIVGYRDLSVQRPLPGIGADAVSSSSWSRCRAGASWVWSYGDE